MTNGSSLSKLRLVFRHSRTRPELLFSSPCRMDALPRIGSAEVAYEAQ